MGQILHGSARTTSAVRRAIQDSQASLRSLAKRYGVNQKTVIKWKQRSSVEDIPTGPKNAKSTVLSIEQEAIIVTFRQHTLLPLDDCLYALQETIPKLTRSSLHRCLQRHGISRLPVDDEDKPKRKKFKAYPIGYFHIDMAEVRTEQGKLYMFVAIDRTSKLAFVQLHERSTTAISRDFLKAVIAAVPYKIHTVLTDNGIQFTTPGAGGSAVPLIKEAIANGEIFRAHAFELACARNDIEHRTTKPKHPWTNGQVERMNRTLKEATVKRYYYDTHDQLRSHLADFVTAYNLAKRLKTLKGLTPYEYVCKIWTIEPERFIRNPHHQEPGLNTIIVACFGGDLADLIIGKAIANICRSACKVVGKAAQTIAIRARAGGEICIAGGCAIAEADRGTARELIIAVGGKGLHTLFGNG
jgi:transposase